MSSSLDLIRKYYRDSKPDEPITPDDPRWVDLSPLRGSGRDITDLILRRIQREDESETLLVTGFRGDEVPITADVVRRTIDKGVAIAGELPIADYIGDIRALLEHPERLEPRSDADQQRLYQMIRDRVALRYSNGEP